MKTAKAATPSAEDPLLPPRVLSDEWGIPESTLAQWRWRGEGPVYVKLGGHVRYRRSDIDAWLTECARGAR